jgi:hypothetical protein
MFAFYFFRLVRAWPRSHLTIYFKSSGRTAECIIRLAMNLSLIRCHLWIYKVSWLLCPFIWFVTDILFFLYWIITWFWFLFIICICIGHVIICAYFFSAWLLVLFIRDWRFTTIIIELLFRFWLFLGSYLLRRLLFLWSFLLRRLLFLWSHFLRSLLFLWSHLLRGLLFLNRFID